MNIVFFGHPKHSSFRSMDSFTEMLSNGMKERGHNVQVLIPKEVLSRLSTKPSIRKWFGYFDQFVIFPMVAKRYAAENKEDTLFVFTDQALGPWVPLVANKRHIIHCHDFLALKSAQGEIIENNTSWTGKLYQSFIRKGYQKGKNFISVSRSTDNDLERFLDNPNAYRRVVYNGLKPIFKFISQDIAREYIKNETNAHVEKGYIVHVGGNQWYKNRKGVVEIYNAFRKLHPIKLPLLLIGDYPSPELLEELNKSKYKADIHTLVNPDDKFIQNAYAGASALLFPSLAEGFGWPIAEGMACGTVVITTREAPMTEVGGTAAYYIDRRPAAPERTQGWAINCAKIVHKVVCLSEHARKVVVSASILNSTRFDLTNCLDEIESIYENLNESAGK
jgi:glycosyltransferase involved in cell wall biosynthesis